MHVLRDQWGTKSISRVVDAAVLQEAVEPDVAAVTPSINVHVCYPPAGGNCAGRAKAACQELGQGPTATSMNASCCRSKAGFSPYQSPHLSRYDVCS